MTPGGSMPDAGRHSGTARWLYVAPRGHPDRAGAMPSFLSAIRAGRRNVWPNACRFVDAHAPG
jgi:hypothetical protein